jgi:hypothetical protein
LKKQLIRRIIENGGKYGNKKKTMNKLLVLLFANLLFISCAEKVSQNELPGLYEWNNTQKGQLIINQDLTYIYKFDFKMNDTLQNISNWEYDSIMQEIQFHNFRFTPSEGGKGVWISRVRKKNNEIHLIYASDSDIYLVKTE